MPNKRVHIRKKKNKIQGNKYVRLYNNSKNAKYSNLSIKANAESNPRIKNYYFKATSINSQNNVKFSDALDLWLNANKIHIKASTYNKYFNVIETHIKPNIGNYYISNLNSYIINQFLSEKLTNGRIDNKGGLSPNYVATMALIIKSTIQYCANENLCENLKNPIYKPAKTKTSPHILNDYEIEELIKYTKNNINKTSLGIMLSLFAGLRIGEVCALKWENVDIENRIIHIVSTVSRIRDDKTKGTKLIIDIPKTKSSIRDIPINDQLFDYIKQFESVNGFLLSDNDSFVNPRTFEYRYHNVLRDANIKQINFHSIRHTFASKCIEVGMDVKTLSEILGHSNCSITLDVYVHSSLEIKRKNLNKLVI